MKITAKHLKVTLLICSSIGVVWQVTSWFQKDHFIVSAQAERLDKMEKRQSEADDRWQIINNRLSHIEGVLEEMRLDEDGR